tara:strand:- start:13095 stop:13355 length:261 start_codon:yes stop_codon:yes gene_type:complete
MMSENLLEELLDSIFPRNAYGLTQGDRELIIAQALETEEGRAALARAMVEPIRNALEYQGVGRRMLMAEEFPQETKDLLHEILENC